MLIKSQTLETQHNSHTASATRKSRQSLPSLQELDLKVRQFEMLLRQPPALQELGNVNLVWARLMVEELCRCGINTFCIAPGTLSNKISVLRQN